MQRFPNFHRVRLFKFKISTDGAGKGEQELEKGGNETYAGRHRRRRENAIYCPSSDRASKKHTFHMICRLFPRYHFFGPPCYFAELTKDYFCTYSVYSSLGKPKTFHLEKKDKKDDFIIVPNPSFGGGKSNMWLNWSELFLFPLP